MREARFYNSLTRKAEVFRPRDAGKVRIYNCGPTVYKRQHIGNWRRFLFADFLRRALEFFGYEVREIMNITDVGHLTLDDIEAGEDKLEREAREAKTTPQDIADKQIKLFLQDIKALNIQPAHKYPRATEHIEQQIRMIETLAKNKHAYVTESGVYFDVTSFPNYGQLSGNTLEAIEAGSRVQVRGEKKHPADFALWKTGDKKHLQQWDAPWGHGYPGWHIECSAMSLEYLGPEIDIHTGGEDNKFPHHENEIAQSEAYTGKTFVRFWLHNAWLNLRGVKLAKRAGEQITLDTLAEKGFSPLEFRLLVFGSHYRSPLEFSWESLGAASKNLEGIRNAVRANPPTPRESRSATLTGESARRFADALADDLNTPKAMAVFMDALHAVNRGEEDFAVLEEMDKVLGIIEPLRRELGAEIIPDEIQKMAGEREKAREEKRFEEADKIRIKIENLGYYLEDTNSGPRLRPAAPH